MKNEKKKEKTPNKNTGNFFFLPLKMEFFYNLLLLGATSLDRNTKRYIKELLTAELPPSVGVG